jgi:hypothetical protein
MVDIWMAVATQMLHFPKLFYNILIVNIFKIIIYFFNTCVSHVHFTFLLVSNNIPQARVV